MTVGRDSRKRGPRFIGNAGLTSTVEAKNLFQNIMGEPSGFQNRTDSAISKVDGTRTLTIQPTGTAFEFYTKSNRFRVSTPQNIVWTDVEGLHYFYFNDSGVLTHSVNDSDFYAAFLTGALVALLYWDATNNATVFFADERHGTTMDGQTHLQFHFALGAILAGTGGALTGITADGDGSSDTHAQFAVAATSIRDEDLQFNFTDGNPQDLSPIAQIPVWYRSGASGDWRKKSANNFPLIYSDGVIFTGPNGRAPYNQLTGGVWQLTEVGQLQLFCVHYFATNDVAEPIVGIQGQAEYGTIIAARDGAEIEISNLKFGELPTPEFVPLGSVIYQTSTTYTNTPATRIRTTDTGEDYVDFRFKTFVSSGGGVDVHALGGAAHSADTLANLNSKVSDATLDDSGDPRDPNSHASSHQDGGGDEISVAGLSGELTDPQPPKTHASSHSDGGSDEITVDNLGAGGTDGQVLTSDGVGGCAFEDAAGGGTPDVGFYGYRASGNQTLTSGVETKVQYPNKQDDPGGDFNTSTYVFTAPTTGRYVFSASAQITLGAAGRAELRLYHGSTLVSEGGSRTNQAESIRCTTSVVRQMTASTTMEVRAYQASGFSATIQNTGLHFSGAQLRAD